MTCIFYDVANIFYDVTNVFFRYPTCFAVGAFFILLVGLCIGYRIFVDRDREVFHIKTGNVTYDSGNGSVQRVAIRY